MSKAILEHRNWCITWLNIVLLKLGNELKRTLPITFIHPGPCSGHGQPSGHGQHGNGLVSRDLRCKAVPATAAATPFHSIWTLHGWASPIRARTPLLSIAREPLSNSTVLHYPNWFPHTIVMILNDACSKPCTNQRMDGWMDGDKRVSTLGAHCFSGPDRLLDVCSRSCQLHDYSVLCGSGNNNNIQSNKLVPLNCVIHQSWFIGHRFHDASLAQLSDLESWGIVSRSLARFLLSNDRPERDQLISTSLFVQYSSTRDGIMLLLMMSKQAAKHPFGIIEL